MSPPRTARAASSVETLGQLRKLQSITEAALAHLALDELLDELLLRMREILNADTAAVLLLDGDELVARAAKGLEEEVEAGVRIPYSRGFAGRVAAERRPIVIDDVDHSDVLSPILHEKGVKSLLGAALLVHDRVLGVIHVGTLKPRKFTAEDVELIELAAERAARGLEKALIHDELVRLDELKRNFIAIASHELRTPATSVHGLARTLRHRRADLDDKQIDDVIRVLDEQSARLVILIEQLLDLSRLDAGSRQIEPRRFAARPQLEGIVAAVATDVPDGSVRIVVPDDLTLYADVAGFECVVSNLVANALKHGAPPVTITAEQRDRRVRIAVEDRGTGVPASFAPLLFDRFSRSEDTERSGRPGSGLGLAIAHSYALAHGGQLIYQPARPHGARFELVLPR